MQKHDVITISLDHAICSTYNEREQDKSQPEDQAFKGSLNSQGRVGLRVRLR